MWLLNIYRLFRDAIVKFFWDKAPRLGAALAFYTALSLSPLLLIVIAIAGVVFGADAARGEISTQVHSLVGEEGAKAVEAMLQNNQSQARGLLATIIGLGTLIVGATGVFAQLQDALDSIWGQPPGQAGVGLWAMLWDRVLSFSMVCGLAFLLLVSLVFSAIITGLGDAINSWFPDAALWMQALNAVMSFLLTAAMFAMIFKLLPHARPAWSDVWFGSLITAGLFTVGKALIVVYLGRAAVGSAYGAAGSFVVLLVWIYYSTQILLFGAELTAVYSSRHGTAHKASTTAAGLPQENGRQNGSTADRPRAVVVK
ncbi:MAG: YihY/virulence factor BrkB family protein [Gemmataceae bacterium]